MKIEELFLFIVIPFLAILLILVFMAGKGKGPFDIHDDMNGYH